MPPSQSKRPTNWVEAHGKAMQIKSRKAEQRIARGEERPGDRRRAGMEVQPVARVADCPEHGLHGERERCFECGGAVDHPTYVAARWVAAITLAALIVGYLIGLVF